MIFCEDLYWRGRISDKDLHQLEPKNRIAIRGEVQSAAICVGPRCLIGGHYNVLKDLTVVEGAVVGAGSAASCDIRLIAVSAGVPARKLRELRKGRC
jgi:acetyltransferase-like isoleucine patch superfamily enzyme